MQIVNPVWSSLVKYIPENNRLERIWKLAQIDFKRRYYNDRLGLVWALINPIFQIVVYYYVFVKIFHVDEFQFHLFLFAGIIIWGLFAEITNGGMAVVRSKLYLIENIQFNKLDLFISQALSVLMGFFFNLFIYFLIAIPLGAVINLNVLYLVIVLITICILSIGISMILATVVIYVDDMKHLWDLILFAGFWASGIVFNIDKFIEYVPKIVLLNPFLGILRNCRNAMLYGVPPDFSQLLYNLGIALLFFIIGAIIFRRSEHLVLEKI